MEQLKANVSLEGFFVRLSACRRSVLFLDYDGTLAPFRPDPSQAYPYPGVRSILQRIVRQPRCRTVVVTGRCIDDLLPLLPEAASLEIWGAHGREHRTPGGVHEVLPLTESARIALEQAHEIACGLGLAAHCEAKPGCLAFHHRSLPDEQSNLASELHTAWRRLQQPGVISLHSFDGGVELRAEGRDKGDVIRTILREMPADTPAAYLGDDLTDEDAFRALGDRGLSCLVRGEFRPTAADCWIRPPEELLVLLERWHLALAVKGERHAQA